MHSKFPHKTSPRQRSRGVATPSRTPENRCVKPSTVVFTAVDGSSGDLPNSDGKGKPKPSSNFEMTGELALVEAAPSAAPFGPLLEPSVTQSKDVSHPLSIETGGPTHVDCDVLSTPLAEGLGFSEGTNSLAVEPCAQFRKVIWRKLG